jgi:hypothetical protein
MATAAARLARRTRRAGSLGLILGLVVWAPAQGNTPGSWQTVGDLKDSRHGHTATLLTDGSVLVTGGEGQKAGQFPILASAERFDPQTNTFNTLDPLNEGRALHKAVRLQDGRVLIIGGINEDGVLASAELFDPATGRFAPVGAMLVPRFVAVASLLPDGRVLVAGGAGDDFKALASAELFDPATGEFQETGSMTVPRALHTAVTLRDGRIAIIGGKDEENQSIRRIEIYNPQTGTFSPMGETTPGRQGATAHLLPSGSILVVGGLDVDAQGNPLPNNSIEVYDPDTGQSVITDTLQEARFSHVAVSLEDGRILVAGGWPREDPKALLRSAALINPETGKATATEPLPSERADAAGVLLPGGHVLVVGGVGRSGNRIAKPAAAELYLP